MKEARTQAFANRRIAPAGGDPLADKRCAKGAPTFAEAAAVVVEQKRSGWRNPKHAQDWPASLERFVFPRFGQRSVSEVTGADILGVLAPIWHEKPETARRVRHRIGAVMQWAVAMEYRPDNPCERVAAIDPSSEEAPELPKPRQDRHRPAVGTSAAGQAASDRSLPQ